MSQAFVQYVDYLHGGVAGDADQSGEWKVPTVQTLGRE